MLSSRTVWSRNGTAAFLLVGGGSDESAALRVRHCSGDELLKLRIERMQMDPSGAAQPKRFVQNTLASRTLTALPGEVFV